VKTEKKIQVCKILQWLYTSETWCRRFYKWHVLCAYIYTFNRHNEKGIESWSE